MYVVPPVKADGMKMMKDALMQNNETIVLRLKEVGQKSRKLGFMLDMYHNQETVTTPYPEHCNLILFSYLTMNTE